MGELPQDKLLKEDGLQRLRSGPDETHDETHDEIVDGRLEVESKIESDHGASLQFRKPGDTVARHFEVISVLGCGGQSVVYKARHQVLDKVCAVKIMLPDRILNDQIVRRFKQEAQAVSKLDHPGIVNVHAFDVDASGQPYIVMDYVEGRPLSSIIQELGCLPESKAVALITQAVDALSQAHSKGVVHRDLKPSNLIVATEDDGRQTIRLVDFGIAKITTPDGNHATLTGTGEVMGSPLYMSPEQCLAKPVDFHTDIYSLGCVLHECLTGKPPFQSDSFLGTIMAHVQEPLKITDNRVTSAMKSILQRCLAKDPTARYDSMVDLKADLQKAAKGLPVDSQAEGEAQPNHYSKLQKKLPLLLPAVCLIASVCLFQAVSAGYELFKSNSKPPPTTVSRLYRSGGSEYVGAFRPPDMVPLHGSSPITFWSTDHQKADKYIDDTMELFRLGQYQKAIEELKFCTGTYKENGTNYGDPDIETAFLGEAYYHLYQCYLAENDKSEAASSLREAVRLFGKIKLTDQWSAAAIGEYANLLRVSGKDAEAGKMLAEYESTGRVTSVPDL